MMNVRRHRGMTLVEILVAMALFSIFTLTLTQLLMGGMRTYKRGQAISSLRSDLKLAMETVANDVRVANSIGGLVGGTKSLGFNLTTYRQDLTNASQTETTATTISYSLSADEGVLIRTVGTTSTLVARDLLVNSVAGSSESYFLLSNDESDENNPNMEVEIRLSALRYVGTDEQRLSMVTHAMASATYAATYSNKRVDMIPVKQIGDLCRPLRRPLVR
ncbi:type II secretion system protein [bacterium]|nr:type II secretion system protein [bacterium]